MGMLQLIIFLFFLTALTFILRRQDRRAKKRLAKEEKAKKRLNNTL